MIELLVVDDEAPIRQWLKYCIDQIPQCHCTLASNGREALALYQANPPHIVLADIEMPVMNGLEMLQKMRQLHTEPLFLLLTSHSDFDYARQAVQLGVTEYLLKTEMDETGLQQLILRTKEKLQERLDTSISVQSLSSALTHVVRTNSMDMTKPVISVVWQGDGIPKLQWRGSQHTLEMGDNQKVSLLQKEDGIVKDQVIELCIRCSQDWAGTCGISDVAVPPYQLETVVRQAQLRSGQGFYRPGQRVFADGAPQEIAAVEDGFILQHLRAMLNQDYAQALVCVEDFFEKVEQACPPQQDSLRKTLRTTTVSFLHFTMDTTAELESHVERVKAAIGRTESLPTLRQVITEQYQPMEAMANRVTQTSPAIGQAVQYLEQHYAEKISLGDMAHRGSFSPEHFSRLFRKEMGVPFVAYLNNLRMRHAVELLETSSLKIYEIAEEVGFQNFSYFSTTFKKKFGLNPYEYQLGMRK